MVNILAQEPEKFVINLLGSEEVPSVQTIATGVAEFKKVLLVTEDVDISSITFGP